MRRILFAGLAVLAACSTGRAGPSPSVATPPATRDSLEILDREQRLWAAEQRRDRSAVDALMASDYVYLSSVGGKDRTKREDLDLRFGPEVVLGGYHLSSLRAAQVSTDVWAVHYMARQRILRRGVWICPMTGTSETWVRRESQWVQRTRTEYLDGAPPPPACTDSLTP